MRQLIPALLLLTLLVPAAAAVEVPVTRAQFVSALWSWAGSPPCAGGQPFSDVPQTAPWLSALCWAAGEGLVRGTGGLLFTPDRPITREEAAILLRRYAARLGRDVSFPEIARCNDFEDISPWADDSLYWATGTGLIGWSEGGRLDPQGTPTHPQRTSILTPFTQKSPKKAPRPADPPFHMTIFSSSSQVGPMASISPQVSNFSSIRAQVTYQ